MVAQMAYTRNLSIDEFLYTAFILMKRKVEKIYQLSIKKDLSLEEKKSKYEMSSQVMESLLLLQGSLDPKSESYSEQLDAYSSLQLFLLKGNTEDPIYFKKFLNSLPKSEIK